MNGLIKLCGFTREADVHAAIEAGADAFGFVFWPKSPRWISPERVCGWEIPSDRLKVGVFVDQPVEEVRKWFDLAGLGIAQLHGHEDAAYIAKLDRPVWKSVHLDRLPESLDALPSEALLIDSGTVSMPGGTGLQVDTLRARAFIEQSRHKVLLAGGLKPDTVGHAIHITRPFGVDVSSGIETEPGVKSHEALADFVREARKAFTSLSPQPRSPS